MFSSARHRELRARRGSLIKSVLNRVSDISKPCLPEKSVLCVGLCKPTQCFTSLTLKEIMHDYKMGVWTNFTITLIGGNNVKQSVTYSAFLLSHNIISLYLI
jgi:hypothetical protein